MKLISGLSRGRKGLVYEGVIHCFYEGGFYDEAMGIRVYNGAFNVESDISLLSILFTAHGVEYCGSDKRVGAVKINGVSLHKVLMQLRYLYQRSVGGMHQMVFGGTEEQISSVLSKIAS